MSPQIGCFWIRKWPLLLLAETYYTFCCLIGILYCYHIFEKLTTHWGLVDCRLIGMASNALHSNSLFQKTVSRGPFNSGEKRLSSMLLHVSVVEPIPISSAEFFLAVRPNATNIQVENLAMKFSLNHVPSISGCTWFDHRKILHWHCRHPTVSLDFAEVQVPRGKVALVDRSKMLEPELMPSSLKFHDLKGAMSSFCLMLEACSLQVMECTWLSSNCCANERSLFEHFQTLGYDWINFQTFAKNL